MSLTPSSTPKHPAQIRKSRIPPPSIGGVFPIGGVTARAIELLRVGQWFKRLPSDFPIPFEVWETFVMPHMVTRDYKRPRA